MTVFSGHELDDRSQDTPRRTFPQLCNMIVESELDAGYPKRSCAPASVFRARRYARCSRCSLWKAWWTCCPIEVRASHASRDGKRRSSFRCLERLNHTPANTCV